MTYVSMGNLKELQIAPFDAVPPGDPLPAGSDRYPCSR